MKNLICSIVTLILVSSSVTGFSQSGEVISGLSTGDADLIAQYFSNDVWLCIGDTEDEYSASEAKKVLGTFFNTNSVQSFTKLHGSGKSNAKTEVLVGKLMTSSKTFRVHVYINKGKNPKIDELRIVVP